MQLGEIKNEPLAEPTLIELSKIGTFDLGYITVVEGTQMPFAIQRAYWTYYTPDSIIRGFHAHRKLKQLIMAVSGGIEFRIESPFAKEYRISLNRPDIGLYIPPLHWREMKLSHNAVLLCLASLPYDESDYIRDHAQFLEVSRSVTDTSSDSDHER